jgi:Kef-type K+ transport system membrane component KefB
MTITKYVIAEVIVGILLGPSAMGYIPGFTETIFPKPSLPLLAIVANLGLIFFLFLVGMELDPSVLRQHAKKAVFTSVGGIVVPFGLGAAVSWLIYNTYMLEPQITPAGVVKPVPGFGAFLAFMGVAMSITAFPVLARIMTERNLLTTPVGTATMAAAAVDDVVAWTLLALVVSVVIECHKHVECIVHLPRNCSLGAALFLWSSPVAPQDGLVHRSTRISQLSPVASHPSV